MKDRNQTMIVTALSIVLLLFVVFAVSSRNRTPGTQPKAAPQGQVLPGTPNLNLGGTQNNKNGTQNGILNNNNDLLKNADNNTKTKIKELDSKLVTDQKRAKRIDEQIRNISGVKNSVTAVSGDTAIVGCQFTDKVKDKKAKNAEIAKKVKAFDKTIKNCKVSNSTNVIAIINNYDKGIKSGVSQDNNNFNSILKQLAPATR